MNANFYPSYIRSEFNFTCKEKYVDNDIFKVKTDTTKLTVKEAGKCSAKCNFSCSRNIRNAIKEEVLALLIILCSCYTRPPSKSIKLHNDDNEAKNILLQNMLYTLSTKY